jgi:hypothetical protein
VERDTAMTAIRWNEAGLAAVMTLAVVVAFAVVVDNLPVREVVVIAYLGVGPGAAVVWLARIDDRALQLALVVPLSLTVDAMVATGLLYAGIWSPPLAFAVIAAFTALAVLLGVRERTAMVPLVGLTLLPPIVLLMGQV